AARAAGAERLCCGRRERHLHARRSRSPRACRRVGLPDRRKPDAETRCCLRDQSAARASPDTDIGRGVMANSLTHIGKRGEARMVDVSAKAATTRVAVAEGRVVMTRETLRLVLKGNAKKGDVLGVARIAG